MFATRTFAMLALAVVAGTAVAQSPAPADASATAGIAAAAAALCPKPDPHPGRLASPEKRRGWGREVNTWQECMKKYIAELDAKADKAVKTANAAVAESSAAIAIYNSTVKEFQAQSDAAAN